MKKILIAIVAIIVSLTPVFGQKNNVEYHKKRDSINEVKKQSSIILINKSDSLLIVLNALTEKTESNKIGAMSEYEYQEDYWDDRTLEIVVDGDKELEIFKQILEIKKQILEIEEEIYPNGNGNYRTLELRRESVRLYRESISLSENYLLKFRKDLKERKLNPNFGSRWKNK